MTTNQELRDLTQTRAQIAFGLDVQAFMRSEIGEYLTQRANDHREAALEALAAADPEDTKGIRQLQNVVQCAQDFLLWMGEAVTEGENAQATFVESQD